MKRCTVKRAFGAAVATLAAIAMFSATPAVSQEESGSSVAAVPPSPARPDPSIAQGLEIFDEKGHKIGLIEDIGTRDGQQVAIVAVQDRYFEPAQRVVVPFHNIQVSDGLLRYDVANASRGDPLRRDPNDDVDWESMNEIYDVHDK